jgi:hypothetical protein
MVMHLHAKYHKPTGMWKNKKSLGRTQFGPDARTDARMDRVITIGRPPQSGGALIIGLTKPGEMGEILALFRLMYIGIILIQILSCILKNYINIRNQVSMVQWFCSFPHVCNVPFSLFYIRLKLMQGNYFILSTIFVKTFEYNLTTKANVS